MNEQAIKTLENNIILNIDMLEPIKRGHGEIIYADHETVLLNELNSQSYMLYSENIQKAIELLDKQPTNNIHALCLHQKELLDFAKEKFGFKNTLVCYQTANLSKKLAVVPDTLEIKKLDKSFKNIIYTHYQNYTLEELEELLEEGQIFGGFKENELVGFMGIHKEGSCGLLEILPQYRQKGYGSTLEAYLNNYVINKGWIPYGQVVEDNHKSLSLQKKLGLDISKEKIYWTF